MVPWGKDGNVLEEPKQKEHWTSEGFGAYSMSIKDIENYNKAKERVLFMPKFISSYIYCLLIYKKYLYIKKQ